MPWYFLSFQTFLLVNFFVPFSRLIKSVILSRSLILRDGRKHGHLKRNPHMTFTKNRSTCCIRSFLYSMLHWFINLANMLYLCYRTDKKISFHKLTSKLSPSKFHLSQENLNNNKIKTNIKTTYRSYIYFSYWHWLRSAIARSSSYCRKVQRARRNRI